MKIQQHPNWLDPNDYTTFNHGNDGNGQADDGAFSDDNKYFRNFLLILYY